MRPRLVLACALSILALASCRAKESEIREVELSLGAAAAIAHSAAIGMNAMSGSSLCATVVAGCAAYPCEGEVTVTLGGDCPLPLGGAATGTVTVSGTWSSADSATLSATFVNVVASGERNLVVVNATSLSVERAGDLVTVSYVGQNVDVTGAIALTSQSVWDVVIDTAGTPDDPADDIYTIDGADQSVGGTSTVQVTVEAVVLDPACTLNPIAGSATLQEVSVTTIANRTIDFHPTCDGTAEVGSDTVEVDFLE